ncbi:MAG TPA: carboxypeptidase-like regulatory domain-containing protein, partial [Blastocatellia bacterium]|nr:carboxypeptidase-like regulatory domain-containing protein [Blastocatellia bacterium]
MRKRFAIAMLAIQVLVFVFPLSLFAQSNTGTLLGTVSGPDGVIAGAKVVVKDDSTGRERTVKTSDEGTFTIPQLEVGTYTVTISA